MRLNTGTTSNEDVIYMGSCEGVAALYSQVILDYNVNITLVFRTAYYWSRMLLGVCMVTSFLSFGACTETLS